MGDIMNIDILDYINNLEIIDTHEHLLPFEAQREHNDVVSEYLTHYFSVDLVTAGLSLEQFDQVRGNEMSVIEKWNCIEQYWDRSRFTGYGQALALTARDIYGIDEINRGSIEELNRRYLATFSQQHYHKILKEKSKIKVAILDRFEEVECDKEYFIIANYVNPLVYPKSNQNIVDLEKETGISIITLEDYLRACEKRIDQFLKSSKILKCALAYSRSLDFARTEKHLAENGFHKIITNRQSGNASDDFVCDIDFSNYMFRYIVSLAQERGMVMQIHTGIQEGHGNILSNSHPGLLNPIFMDYPDMKFDIFHIGYPYQSELGVMCKMFKNVSIDMCWAHIVSPLASRNILSEWLEFLPYNKINGFGGDYCFIDGVYGHQSIARRNIAEVLSEKAQRGLFTVSKACEIGKAILYDNPAELFGIEK
jgi:predicted TIM-barrel fold metal-dependent hydrolase